MSLLHCSPSASQGALIPTQVHTPVQIMPKPTIFVQAMFCVRMFCALGAKTEMPNQVRGKFPERKRLKKDNASGAITTSSYSCQESLYPLHWSIFSLPTCSKVSKILPLASEEKKLLFRYSFECELPEVKEWG